MATLKDIAKLAGVSHGTVSNVLSGKENVSSDKIMRVQAAAKQLGYTVNTYAKSLRAGSAKILALVLPNIDEDRYNDIYYGFKVRCEMEGYELSLCLTNDIPSRELSAIGKLRSDMVMGIAAVSCLTGAKNQYVELGFEEAQIVFLERKPSFRCSYIGFDYYEAGANFGKRAAKKGVENALITSAPLFL